MKTTNLLAISVFILMLFISALILPGTVQAQYYGCTNHSYQRCVGNNIYWYDSCGTQQDLAQYCQNGCLNGLCQNNYNNNNYNGYNYNCTYHAYRLCSGNNIYWYDSCGTQQDLYNSCSNGLTCQYGQCVTSTQNYNYNNNTGTYIPYYKTICSGSVINWYDSFGAKSGLYRNCADKNSCTIDSCVGDKCSNALKCDGSTCAVNSTDYNAHCATTPATNQNHCGNGLCESALEETNINCPNDCKVDTNQNQNPNTNNNTNPNINTNTNASELMISFFAKKNSASGEWQKTAEAKSNDQVYFMIYATNNSTTQIDNVNILANIPREISSLGNLQVNGIPTSGNIISGVNIGSLGPKTTKSIIFEGKTQTLSENATKQATATINISGSTAQTTTAKSDSISINLIPNQNQNQAAAAVSLTPATSESGFMGFFKQWYVWILIGLILIFLFIIVYRRLSSNV
ncbi:MAG: hypothetical protein NT094_05800 [Candidatus Staskawiczbacteria bacterium]|nr:hypothetical protein [Candidatus Staskawiczbacteria bacterium]